MSKRQTRCLRGYESVANKDHGTCCKCDFPIFLGDPYFAIVLVRDRRLWVEKEHIGCPFDPENDEPSRGVVRKSTTGYGIAA
jgi:hypothetical protein